MSSSSNTGSKRSSSTKTKKSTAKSTSTKAKKRITKKKTTTAKTPKTKSTKEKTVKTTKQNNNATEKIITNIERLGNQTFALSPFSQYYDDWINNLRQTVTAFETSANIKIDKTFTKKCERALSDIETSLTELRTQETALVEKEKTLHTVKQDLKELESNYTKKKHELNNKQNTDSQELTTKIKTLEDDIVTQGKLKFGFFQFSAKKAATKKLEQTKQNLKEAKNQLETILQNLTLEQNELHDRYIAKKQELATKSVTLRTETEQLEVDTSIEARKTICTHLINIINEFVKEQTTKPSN